MITRALKKINDFDFHSGQVILIDKLKGYSSFSAVYQVRKVTGVKKVGHAGTLDPLASGLLILCTGKKTKEISGYQDKKKVYTGIISLGKKTLSMDSETEFIEEKGIDGITEEEIFKVREQFVGNIKQFPPMYSAVKHNGKCLYKYARKGKEVIRESREVFVEDFKITKIELPDVHFEISCSKGTYIRVIADDFGLVLGCGGYLKELRRTRIGDYSVEDALTIANFRELYNNE